MTPSSSAPATPSTQSATTVYCPACGENSAAPSVEILAPGNFEWICQECGTAFRIEIGFVPLGEGEND